MALVTWQSAYSVHVAEFDAQHQYLFKLLNQLNDAMAQGKANDVLGKILRELVTYTKTHFSAEERYLEARKYPGYAAHKLEHDNFTRKVSSFEQDFAEGRASLSSRVLVFLRDWLTRHIFQSDKQYAGFLAARQ